MVVKQTSPHPQPLSQRERGADVLPLPLGEGRGEGAPPVDPITAEIVRSALVAITDEMKTNLMRTAYNMIIYESLDFTVGLFDADGNTISIGLGLPMFIRGLSDAIKAKLAHYGQANIRPGDILLTNDSYIMGSHLNHMIFTLPIFWEGELVAFSASMGHWQDVGGTLRGTTTDIYEEGLQLPIVKIYREGQVNAELVEIIKSNVRFPDLAMGDFRAQIASIKTGERRVVQLLQRHGRDAVLGSIQHLFAYSAEVARQAVQAIPDGVYEAESFMDDDGVRLGQPIPLRVRVRVAGDRMTVDLSRVSRQVAGYFNSGETAGRSAAQVAFKCLTSPLLLPINDGSFAPLDVVLPPGHVVSATKPAAVRKWQTIPMTLVDTIIRALAPAMPDKVAAGHHADLLLVNTFGTDPRTGRFTVGHAGNPGGGWGAKPDSDGMSAVVCINDGDTHNTPVEATEAKTPYVIEEYSLLPDTGGPGRQRGGLGVRRVTRVLGDLAVNSFTERTQCAPWGLFGGREGRANRIAVRRRDGTVEQFTNGKLNAYRLAAGDAIVIDAGGGGGYGPAWERPAERVQADVREGYVSLQAARDDYGVVLDPRTLALDEAATTARRADLAAAHRADRDGSP
ncbi:MAG TPA: hydantoinase B/oxoprolinase family protein [Chloroflexota bacterium]|nr:hydantoinase B/oxoprolinase family protein [Chloroflexota bacterium]